jgi:hypothetical protein
VPQFDVDILGALAEIGENEARIGLVRRHQAGDTSAVIAVLARSRTTNDYSKKQLSI